MKYLIKRTINKFIVLKEEVNIFFFKFLSTEFDVNLTLHLLISTF